MTTPSPNFKVDQQSSYYELLCKLFEPFATGVDQGKPNPSVKKYQNQDIEYSLIKLPYPLSGVGHGPNGEMTSNGVVVSKSPYAAAVEYLTTHGKVPEKVKEQYAALRDYIKTGQNADGIQESLYCIRISDGPSDAGKKRLVIVAGMHSRELFTSEFLMDFLDRIMYSLSKGQKKYEYAGFLYKSPKQKKGFIDDDQDDGNWSKDDKFEANIDPWSVEAEEFKSYLKSSVLYVVPCVNPIGRSFIKSEIDILHQNSPYNARPEIYTTDEDSDKRTAAEDWNSNIKDYMESNYAWRKNRQDLSSLIEGINTPSNANYNNLYFNPANTIRNSKAYQVQRIGVQDAVAMYFNSFAPIGVDINRNFEAIGKVWKPWEYYAGRALRLANGSPDLLREEFMGESPLSAAESKNLAWLTKIKDISGEIQNTIPPNLDDNFLDAQNRLYKGELSVLDIHSYGRLIMVPWSVESNGLLQGNETDPQVVARVKSQHAYNDQYDKSQELNMAASENGSKLEDDFNKNAEFYFDPLNPQQLIFPGPEGRKSLPPFDSTTGTFSKTKKPVNYASLSDAKTSTDWGYLDSKQPDPKRDGIYKLTGGQAASLKPYEVVADVINNISLVRSSQAKLLKPKDHYREYYPALFVNDRNLFLQHKTIANSMKSFIQKAVLSDKETSSAGVPVSKELKKRLMKRCFYTVNQGLSMYATIGSFTDYVFGLNFKYANSQFALAQRTGPTLAVAIECGHESDDGFGLHIAIAGGDPKHQGAWEKVKREVAAAVFAFVKEASSLK